MLFLIENIFSKDYLTNHSDLVLFTVIVLVVAFILSWILRAALSRYIHFSSEKLNIDPTRLKFMRNAIPLLIFFLALLVIIYSIPSLKTVSLSLFAGAGVLAVVLGFASQEAFSNIISGIFIVIFKPFRVHDRVQIGKDYSGIIEDITLRHTVIRSYKNERIFIPNSVINKETLINSTYKDNLICNFLDLNIAFDSDINKATEIIQAVAVNHPQMLDNRSDAEIAAGSHPVDVLVIGFSEYATRLRAYVWSKDPGSGYVMLSDLRKSIKARFDSEGIEIPSVYKYVVNKKS